jgi:hypothetical protein
LASVAPIIATSRHVTVIEQVQREDPLHVAVEHPLAAHELVAHPATIDPKCGPSITARRRPRPLEIPGGFLRVCVLAWRRRRPTFQADGYETDH